MVKVSLPKPVSLEEAQVKPKNAIISYSVKHLGITDGQIGAPSRRVPLKVASRNTELHSMKRESTDLKVSRPKSQATRLMAKKIVTPEAKTIRESLLPYRGLGQNKKNEGLEVNYSRNTDLVNYMSSNDYPLVHTYSIPNALPARRRIKALNESLEHNPKKVSINLTESKVFAEPTKQRRIGFKGNKLVTRAKTINTNVRAKSSMGDRKGLVST